MSMVRHLVVGLGVLLGGAGVARAADPVPLPPPVEPDLSHRHQVGLSLQPGLGYRVLFPYDEQYCGQTDDNGGAKSVCSEASPAYLDLGLSYGLSASVELLASMRLGLQRDFANPVTGASGPRPFTFSFGGRFYVVESGMVKFFSTAEIVIETTDYADPTLDSPDLGLRNTNGVLFDIIKNVGVYLAFGETITFRTWLRFQVEGGVGVQVRFP